MYYYKKIFFLVAFVACAPYSFSANRVVHYQPEIVKLAGLVETQTFPGKPNYQSIKNGDEIEKGVYLRLNYPIDVAVLSDDDINENENNVKVIQIADDSLADWQELKKGGNFYITGRLFHRISGHHHSRVLIDVEKIERIE